MEKYIKPDYSNSNINISSTIAEFLGVQNKLPTLSILKDKLNKNYKNVVFICFDGMGINPININLKRNHFIRKNVIQKLVSTFPSTTTNATTSLLLNKVPLQHGWLGWSIYFKTLNRNVDVYLNSDSLTGEKLDINNSPLDEMEYYFNSVNSDYNVNLIYPNTIKVDKPYYIPYEEEQDFFKTIKTVCKKNNKQFIYAYYPDPDSTMHKYGVSSKEAKEVFKSINENLKKLYYSLTDTLIIVTADHGQVDITGYVELYKDKKLMDLLKIYPYLECRVPAFIVKDGKHKEFEEYFTRIYGKDFELHKSSELIDLGYFGDFCDKKELLGDYIAIGTYTHKMAILTPDYPRFKGHHSSLTEEMEVPLIVLEKTKI